MGGPATQDLWISTFLEAQAAELGAATNTLLAYGRDLKDFAGFLSRKNSDFATADRDQVEAYLIDCDAQGLAQSTRARRLSAIKQLYRFAFEEGWRDSNPVIQIKADSLVGVVAQFFIKVLEFRLLLDQLIPLPFQFLAVGREGSGVDVPG